MPLPLRLTPEAFDQWAAEHPGITDAYRQSPEGDYVPDLENIDAPDHLKSAHEKQKQETAMWQARIEAARNATPERMRELMEQYERSQANLAGYAEAERALREQHVRELAEHTDNLAKARKDFEAESEAHVVDVWERVVTAAIAEHNGSIRLLTPHLLNRTRAYRDEQGDIQVRVIDGRGIDRLRPDGTALTVSDMVEELKVLDPSFAPCFLRRGPRSSGSGSNGSMPLP